MKWALHETGKQPVCSGGPAIVRRHTLHTQEGKRRNKAKLMNGLEWPLQPVLTHTLNTERPHIHILHPQIIIRGETLVVCCLGFAFGA